MKNKYRALEPDEIFIDSQNLPAFDQAHLEGRIERPLGAQTFTRLRLAFVILALALIGQTTYLTVVRGDELSSWADNNRLQHQAVIAERGLLLDRNGAHLADNVATTTETDQRLVTRSYPLGAAAAQLVGYVSYPKRDQNGNWYQDTTEGVSGAELLLDAELRGQNGVEIVETNATGKTVSGSVVREPMPGKDITLSIDGELQKAMYDAIKERVDASYLGGAGVVMDIETGELLSLVSYPSFDPSVMSSGVPKELVTQYVTDPRSPFLDRAVTGLYTPGSIVKPFIAAAALQEGTVLPETTFVSTGQLVVPNPYDPKKPSIFKDWRAHGAVDMRRAIAVSSDVYFYIVGGGFESQRGLGISNIDRYAKLFGFGTNTGFPLEGEPSGTIPTPEWKAKTFDDPVWRVGDTYITAIGQYGWQVTLLQAVRAVGAIGNGGTLVAPSIIKGAPSKVVKVPISDANLQVVREGMRQSVTGGTSQSLAFSLLHVAAKTGTAEVGVNKEETNSLVIGFFPYEHPRYAFAMILEHAKAGTALGAPAAMQRVLSWVITNRPAMYTLTAPDDTLQ